VSVPTRTLGVPAPAVLAAGGTSADAQRLLDDLAVVRPETVEVDAPMGVGGEVG
jgi:hypothetical protein